MCVTLSIIEHVLGTNLMTDNTLTITLDGDVTLPNFVEAILHFRNLVDLLSREVASNSQIEWLIDDLQTGSAIATVVGLSEEEEAVQKVVTAYTKVGQSLQRRDPIPFSEGVAREATAITKVIGERIISIRFQTEQDDTVVYGSTDKLQSAPKKDIISFGTIKGKVQTISSRGKLKFTLYDPIFDKAITCYLDEQQEGKLKEIWGKQIHVTGRINRAPDSGRAVSIREITNIEPVIEVPPGSFKRARGIFNWSEGDEPAESIVRRTRDAED
jgi:hypothetical protein